MSRRNHEQIQDSSQEAEEVEEHVELEEQPEDPSEEEGEDLLEDAERDYQSIEVLKLTIRYLIDMRTKELIRKSMKLTRRPEGLLRRNCKEKKGMRKVWKLMLKLIWKISMKKK
jgi:hypothetical protein